MYYTREQHKRFLDKELQAISENYIRVLNTKATALLSENEVYVAQFMKVDLEKDVNQDDVFKGSGQVVLKFKKDKGIPRKNEYFTAILLDGDKCLPRNWGNLSWAELRKFQVEYSEVHCVWQGKANDNGFLLCGFNGMSMNMAKYLKEKNLSGCVIVLGPQEPPMEYYQNLISFVSSTSPSEPAAKILDFNDSGNNNGPSTINDDDTARFVTEEIENTKKGIHNPQHFMKLTPENYKLIEDDFIKIITLAPELDEGLLDYLSGKNIKIQAGHCIGGDLSKCTGCTHLFNAMSEITHRGASTALSSLISDTIFTEIIADGVHVSNDALKLVFKTKPADKIILISDSLPITKSNLKEITFADEKVYYDGIKATSKDGTIAGSTTMLPDIIKRLASLNMFNPEYINNPYDYHNIALNGYIEWDNEWNITNIYHG